MDDEMTALKVAVGQLQTKLDGIERHITTQGRAIEQMKGQLNRYLGGLAAILVVVNLLFAAWARWPSA